MKKSLAALLVLALSAVAFADDQNKEPKDTNKAEDRIRAAATVIDEIESARIRGSRKKYWVRPSVWRLCRRC